MGNYYTKKLNSSRLFDVYETQIEMVKRYFQSEINFVIQELRGNEKVLELGAGYGRIMKALSPFADSIVGIDISRESVEYGQNFLESCSNCKLKVMDAHNLKFDSTFDVALCLQNGISALKGQDTNIVKQSLKILSSGGKAYFSSYSPKFWEHRLAWFHEQVGKGLLGEIDLEKTKDGNIVCKDGFVATTYTQDDMKKLGESAGHDYKILEIDDSVTFLIIQKND